MDPLLHNSNGVLTKLRFEIIKKNALSYTFTALIIM